MPIRVTLSVLKMRLLVELMMSLLAEAALARKVPLVMVRFPPKLGLSCGVMTSPFRTAPATRAAPVPLTRVTVVPEVMSRIYQFWPAGRLVLVTFWPGTRLAVPAPMVMTGLVVPVLAAVLVTVEVMPLATPTDAEAAAVLAARLEESIKVVPSRICAMVAPALIPEPEMG